MYYKLTFEFWDFEWENSEAFFFKTEKEAKAKQKEIEKENEYKNRRFFIEEISFEDMKEEITVEAYEELFGITIEEPKQYQAQMIPIYSDTNLSLAIKKVEREFEAHSNFTFHQPRLTDLIAIQVACSLLQQTITKSKDSELKEYAKRYLESANEKLRVMKACSD